MEMRDKTEQNIRFMQQFERGSGDYVKDRQQWQQNYSVESILKEMAEQAYLEESLERDK